MSEIVVTGATGHIGGRVARLLAAEDRTLKLLVRDPSRAPDLPHSTVAVAGYGDVAAVRSALAGAGTVLMVSAAEAADRLDQHRAFVEAAAAARVGHLVYLSFCNAAPDATFTLARDHHATEERIRATGLPFTFLRDNLYADFLPHLAGPDGVIRGPAGDGRVAAVARRDVADAAAAVLRDPGAHAGRTYTLTGPEALTLAEAAQIITRETGTATTYHPETVEEAYASRAGYDAPRWQLDAWVSTYTAIASGELAGVSGDVERLTGHRPRGLADLLRES